MSLKNACHYAGDHQAAEDLAKRAELTTKSEDPAT